MGRSTGLVGRGACVLVDLKGIDAPVGVLECLGVVANKGVAVTAVSLRARAARPGGPGPGTAEGGVEDDVVGLEVVVDVAAA